MISSTTARFRALPLLLAILTCSAISACESGTKDPFSSSCSEEDRTFLLREAGELRKTLGHGEVRFVDDCSYGMRGSANWYFSSEDRVKDLATAKRDFGCSSYEPESPTEDTDYLKCVLDGTEVVLWLETSEPGEAEIGLTFPQ